MAQLSRIREELNGVALRWSNVKTSVRGLPLYADSLLTGSARFSRKTGSIGLINPDIEVFLNEKLQVNQSQIKVDRYNQWFIVGAYISIGGLEKFRIESISDTTFQLNAQARAPQTTGAPVLLYSVPLITVSDFSAGSTVLQVRSKHQLLIGDKLAFPTLKNLFREIDIINVSDLGTTSNPYPFTYQVTLNAGIPYDLSLDAEIQFRAYPAYFSLISKIPKSPVSARSLGPFLVDLYGGRINSGTTPETFITAQFYDIFTNKVISTDPILISDNYPVFARSIPSDTFLFWSRVAGEMNLKDGKTVLVCDSEGKFGITYDLQPHIKPGLKWKFNVKTTEQTVLRVGFEPNPFTTFNLLAFSNQLLTVGTNATNTLDIEKITIIGKSAPGAEITIDSWVLIGDEVERVALGIMARVEKEAIWLSSSCIIKPYFLSLDYLNTTYDSEAFYDSGYIYL